MDQRKPSSEMAQVIGIARWLLIGLVVVLGWFTFSYLASVLTPVLAALGIAYLLNPILERMTKMGLGRSLGAAILVVTFIGIIVLALVLLIPRLIDQAEDFVAKLPHMFDVVAAWLKKTFNVDLPADWKAALSQVGSSAIESGPAKEFAAAALGGVFSVLGVVTEFLLVPVFSFYFLVDFPHLVRRIDHMVPPRSRATVRAIFREIDSVVSGWVRGQAIVTSILAVLYAIGFTIVGMPLSLPVGLLVGLLTVIPFVGTFVGAAIAITVTLAMGGSTGTLVGVGAVILCLHLLEAGVLTPKIVGHRVGLSETGALFAVVAGGKLLGFVGVVLAVPIAATVAVLARYAVRYYEHTAFFGHESDADVEITPAMAMIMPGKVPNKIISDVALEPEINPELEGHSGIAAVDEPYDWAIEPELGAAGVSRPNPIPKQPSPAPTTPTPPATDPAAE